MEEKHDKRAREPKAIGARLKLFRKALGLTQEDFVARVGMTQGAYAQYERGHRRPSVLLANKIVDAYQWNEFKTGIDLDFIYRGDPGRLEHAIVQAMYPRKVD